MILVELFSKNDCHLCEEAKAVLEKVRREIPFTLKEIKLAEGDQQFEDYQEWFPVVHINKVLTFKYRVNENMLRIKLQQLRAAEHRGSDEEAPA
jgi:glutaredoxin